MDYEFPIPPKFKCDIQSIKGKGVIVTGGTTGIGRATVLLLASQGAKVVIFGRHAPELNDALADIQESIGKSGGEIYGLTADVSRDNDVTKVFEFFDNKVGKLDILVNNAAVAARSILESTPRELHYVIDTNLIGYFYCAREAIARMADTGGNIINIGSLSGEIREGGDDVYVSTKSGILGFTESLRKEINEFGIHVTLIEPGSVGTNMVDEPPEIQRRLEDAGRMLKAEDIAQAIYYVLTQPSRSDIVVLQIRPHLQSI